MDAINVVDEQFRKMCQDIIDNGFPSNEYEVRPRWEDGTPAHTIKTFAVVNRYDVSQGLPLLSLRKTYWKKAIDEILWIWQKKSNNVNELGSRVWDAWADDTGSIGKAYGYQLAQKSKYGDMELDQVDSLLWKLKNNPMDRAMIADMYKHEDLHAMGLRPCAHHIQLDVTNGRLNMLMKQRSQDILAANNWNVVQYSALLMMFAKASGLEPGTLVHVISDAHIYDRHVPAIKELLSRDSFPPARARLVTDKTDFYKFTVDDFVVENYQHGPQIKNIPIAE